MRGGGFKTLLTRQFLVYDQIWINAGNRKCKKLYHGIVGFAVIPKMGRETQRIISFKI